MNFAPQFNAIRLTVGPVIDSLRSCAEDSSLLLKTYLIVVALSSIVVLLTVPDLSTVVTVETLALVSRVWVSKIIGCEFRFTQWVPFSASSHDPVMLCVGFSGLIRTNVTVPKSVALSSRILGSRLE